MRKRVQSALLLLALPALPALAQDPPADPAAPDREPPAVDQARVDAAVGKGAEWLRNLYKKGLPPVDNGRVAGDTHNELVLYTLIHAGVDRGDPDVIKMVNDIRSKPPQHTYTGALRAMAFELYDPLKMRYDLIQCAEFLVNNQAKNGQWWYGAPVPVSPIPKITLSPSGKPPDYTYSGPDAEEGAGPAEGTPPGGSPAAPAAGAPGGAKAGPSGKPGATSIVKPSATTAKKAPKKIVIGRRGYGAAGDNSNTQYAMLGLRACMVVGIYPPPEVFQLNEKWFTEAQNDDGGWEYGRKGTKTYGSMTVGGISSLAVCLRGLPKQRDPRKDPRIQKAVQWMAANLDFGRNPPRDKKDEWHYYWIYGVERAGALAETEWFGDKPWYPEGASWLLGHQNKDGSWGDGDDAKRCRDTCWAILFLRRATQQIVKPKKKVVYTE